jgi:hypothetical protein
MISIEPRNSTNLLKRQVPPETGLYLFPKKFMYEPKVSNARCALALSFSTHTCSICFCRSL